ncbi:MAG: DUF4233 domain-containing protein [Naasia sp.]
MTAAPSGRAPRERRNRGLAEKLGSIVLGFEFVIVFLAALVVGGLGRLSWPLALGLGIGLCVLMLVTAGLLRYRWGIWLGWFCQLVFFAGGFLVGEIFVVAGLFVAMWAYCMIVSGRAQQQPPEGSPAR